jgi:hypothetical protein
MRHEKFPEEELRRRLASVRQIMKNRESARENSSSTVMNSSALRDSSRMTNQMPWKNSTPDIVSTVVLLTIKADI